MHVLDTNVISEVMRPRPEPAVIEWLDSRFDSDLFITAITIAELHYGIARLPPGGRRSTLQKLVSQMVEIDFAERVVAFDGIAAEHYGEIVADRDRSGQPISMADAQIASICRSHRATIVTRNTSDFTGTGIELLNPWG